KPVVPVEPVVDDWEAAEIAEEEKEKLGSGHNSGVEDEAPNVEASTSADDAVEDGSVETKAPVVETVSEVGAVDNAHSEVDTIESESAGPMLGDEQVREAEAA
ncbi:hypothetical protein KCU67_g17808, partial [Aureobasidium melanogenum]